MILFTIYQSQREIADSSQTKDVLFSVIIQKKYIFLLEFYFRKYNTTYSNGIRTDFPLLADTCDVTGRVGGSRVNRMRGEVVAAGLKISKGGRKGRTAAGGGWVWKEAKTREKEQTGKLWR